MSNGKKHGEPKRIGRWYYGGLASAAAACITHPLDLLKVHLQTQQSGKMGLVGMGVKVVKSDGPLALYNGLSASLLRQFTYSLVRLVLPVSIPIFILRYRLIDVSQKLMFYFCSGSGCTSKVSK